MAPKWNDGTGEVRYASRQSVPAVWPRNPSSRCGAATGVDAIDDKVGVERRCPSLAE